MERLFGTLTTELLPTLPGHIPHGTFGKPVTEPTLTLTALDAAIGRFVVGDYNARTHPETGQTPAALGRWRVAAPNARQPRGTRSSPSSPSPGLGWCTATASTSTGCATWT